MKTYLELHVPINYDATWFKELRLVFTGIPVRWQEGFYHSTLAFLNETPDDVDLRPLLEEHLGTAIGPEITFDKLDVFETQSGMYIVYLTSSSVPELFLETVNAIRCDMEKVSCQIQSDFLFHVTLGRVKDPETDLTLLKRLVERVTIPPITLPLTDVDYRVFRGKVLYETKLTMPND
jgi:2'-5' RNA ligase